MAWSLGRRMVRRRVLVAAATLLLWPLVSIEREGQVDAQGTCFVTLPAGQVQGANLGSTCAFLGIPYGAPTAGNNRWRPPQPPSPWTTVLNATGTPVPPVGCPALSVGPTPSFVGDEDCLKLNVWVRNPLPGVPAPVLVWLHTGAFIATSGNFAGHRGPNFALATGVVVVSPNYRLGPFGFLAHDALAAEDADGSTGNYGLLDQQAALRWVRDNIAQFGGDPDNVTIAGTSAGGQSVGLQLVSPGSDGLFHRAVVQSAYPTSRWRSTEEARIQGDDLAASLGCTDLACLRSAPRNMVLTALSQGAQQVAEPANATFWEPSIDGIVIPDQPRLLFASGTFHRVPTIVGFNRDEGWGAFITRSFPSVDLDVYEDWVSNEFGPYAPDVLGLYADVAAQSPVEAMARVVGDAQFVCEGRRLARAIEATGTATFLYSYEHEIDALSLDHVIHGVEGNILFGNNYSAPLPSYTLTDVDRALHAAMAGYWGRFATTGNPNRGGGAEVSWPPFTRPNGSGRGNDKYIVLKPDIGEGGRLREAQCDVFERFFFRSVLGGVPAAAP